MLTIDRLKNYTEDVKKRLNLRGFKELELVDEALSIDEKRREMQHRLNDMQSDMNRMSKEIGQLFQSGKRDEAEALKNKTGEIKSSVKAMEEAQGAIERDMRDLLVRIPNVPHESVPAGNSENDNELLREGGSVPTLHEKAKPHWDLANESKLFDLELGVSLTGSGFPVYTGQGAKLQRSLISYFLDNAVQAGYTEISPPLLVNETTAFGTGQLPDKEGQMYMTKEEPYFLIPTAEVPITNIYRDRIIDLAELPVKMAGHTPCFRREAGSYGKDVRGLNRVHQFDKVEIVQIEHPDRSYETLDSMVSYVEGLVQSLGLPYRIVKLCGGDLGFASAMTYDFEVFSTAQDKWLEVSSVSNFESFQTNRMKIRYKDADGKKHLAHTLNGSALALPRIVAALLENNQEEEGIRMPDVLRPYTGFDYIR